MDRATGEVQAQVAIVGCEDYELDRVRAATRRGIDLLGGA